MSLPMTAPASKLALATDARQVSTDNGTSNRRRERLDRGHDPIELLGLGDERAHAVGDHRGLDASDVEDVGAAATSSSALRRKASKS